MPADYNAALVGLQENLRILSNGAGDRNPEDQIMWNLSNALIVVCDALRHLEKKFES